MSTTNYYVLVQDRYTVFRTRRSGSTFGRQEGEGLDAGEITPATVFCLSRDLGLGRRQSNLFGEARQGHTNVRLDAGETARETARKRETREEPLIFAYAMASFSKHPIKQRRHRSRGAGFRFIYFNFSQEGAPP